MKSTADRIVAGFKEMGTTTLFWGILFVLFAVVAHWEGDKTNSHEMFKWAFPCFATSALISNFCRGYDKK